MFLRTYLYFLRALDYLSFTMISHRRTPPSAHTYRLLLFKEPSCLTPLRASLRIVLFVSSRETRLCREFFTSSTIFRRREIRAFPSVSASRGFYKPGDAVGSHLKRTALAVRPRPLRYYKPDDYLLSHWLQHYHRRRVVSRSCSGWEGVVPTRYGHQA